MQAQPDYITEYLDAFEAVNGFRPAARKSGAWWKFRGHQKFRKGQILAMTDVLKARAQKEKAGE